MQLFLLLEGPELEHHHPAGCFPPHRGRLRSHQYTFGSHQGATHSASIAASALHEGYLEQIGGDYVSIAPASLGSRPRRPRCRL